VPVTDVFDTLQIYLGSLYVNDFNRSAAPTRCGAGRCAVPPACRGHPAAEDAQREGEMVPLSSLVQVKQSFGPDSVMRYNGFTAADINGGPAPGFSSGQAQAAAERIAAETLPKGIASNGPT
jgi:multidrug efflux pump